MGGKKKKTKKTIKLNYGLEARNMAPLWDRAELCALEREREREKESAELGTRTKRDSSELCHCGKMMVDTCCTVLVTYFPAAGTSDV